MGIVDKCKTMDGLPRVSYMRWFEKKYEDDMRLVDQDTGRIIGIEEKKLDKIIELLEILVRRND